MAFFSVFDYVVLSTMLIISAAIGLYYRFSGGKQKTNQEYLLGSRSQGVVPVAFSINASFMSAITLLGTSAEVYSNGFVYVTMNIAHILSVPIITNIYMPVFFNLGSISVYEYLERRFGMATRLSCSLVFTLQILLYMGVALYAPALALEAITGLSRSASIFIIGLVCVFYSALGGIKAVIMTDVFQSLLMYAALFCVIGVTIYDARGFGEIWRVAEASGRINVMNFSLDPTERHSVIAIVIGGMFIFISLFGVNQIQVQRYLTTKDLPTAARSLCAAIPILCLLLLATCFCGLCLLYKYHDCDPIQKGRIESNDQLMPLFVLDSMGNFPGLPGLFVAGIFSAALSTISGGINSLAAVTLEDYLKPLFLIISSRNLSHKKCVFLSKLLTFVFGLLCIGIAFIAQYLGSLLQAALTIFGIVGGPLLATFTQGVLLPSCNEKGALTGLFISLIFTSWLGFGGPKPKVIPLPTTIDSCPGFVNSTLILNNDVDTGYNYLFRISYLYYIVLGFGLSMVLAIIVSQFTEPNARLDPALYAPCIAKYVERKKKKDVEFIKINGEQQEFRFNTERIDSAVCNISDGP